MRRKKDDAAFYEANKDDQSMWEEVEEPTQARSQLGLTATITVRFSADEAEAIRRTARESKLTYSEIVRKAVQLFTRPHFAISSGGTFSWYQQEDATRVAESGLRVETQQEDALRTRTGNVLMATGD